MHTILIYFVLGPVRDHHHPWGGPTVEAAFAIVHEGSGPKLVRSNKTRHTTRRDQPKASKSPLINRLVRAHHVGQR